MDGAGSHRFVEHTGEVELRLSAPTLAGLLTEAGRAIAELMLGEDTGRASTDVEAHVTVSAPDPERLLLAWIDELVYQSETRKAVFTEIAAHATETEATARLRGIAEPVIKTAVKAATLHRLRVARAEAGWEATVVLDV